MEVEETGRSWYGENHNQNILYEKKIYFQLKKEKQYDATYLHHSQIIEVGISLEYIIKIEENYSKILKDFTPLNYYSFCF